MEYDKNKVDSMVLALLYLTKFKDGPDWRTWKGHDWDTMDRLYAQGYISDPKSNAKSVAMTEEGVKQAQELFERHFGTTSGNVRERSGRD